MTLSTGPILRAALLASTAMTRINFWEITREIYATFMLQPQLFHILYGKSQAEDTPKFSCYLICMLLYDFWQCFFCIYNLCSLIL